MWPYFDVHSRDIYICTGHVDSWQSVEGSWHIQCENDAIFKKILNIGQVNCALIVSISLQWPVHICIKLILVFSEMGWDKFFLSHVTFHVEEWRGPSAEDLRYPWQCTTIAAVAAHRNNVSPVCRHGKRCQAVHIAQVHHLLRDVTQCWHSPGVNPGAGNHPINLQQVWLSC